MFQSENSTAAGFFSIWSKLVDAILGKRNSPELAQLFCGEEVGESLGVCSLAPIFGGKNKESFQRCRNSQMKLSNPTSHVSFWWDKNVHR